MKNQIQPLNEMTKQITKRSLNAVVNLSLSNYKKYNENDVINFQNMQTCFFLSLAIPCFFADMMLPLMSGNAKKRN